MDISKTVRYEYWYAYTWPKYGENVNYATWVQTASKSMESWKRSRKTLQKMLRKDLIAQTELRSQETSAHRQKQKSTRADER